jgi:hypothetical protein
MSAGEDTGRHPRIAERYKGFDIWYDPVRGIYYASHCEHTKRTRSLAELKRWLEAEKRSGDPYPVI